MRLGFVVATVDDMPQPGLTPLVWIGLLGLFGCGESVSNRAAQTATVRDSAGIEIVESHAAVWGEGEGWQLSPEPVLRIGSISGNPAEEFSYIRNVVRLSDGKIVVLDSQAEDVRWFDESGRHLVTRGGKGQGPGEFNSAFALLKLPGDTIVVEDRPRIKHVFFGPTGDLVREEFLDMERLSEPGRWVECGGLTLPDRSQLVCKAEPGLTIQPSGSGLFRSYSRFVRVPWTLDAAYPLGLYGGIEQWGIQAGERLAFAIHPFHSRTVRAAGGTPLRIAIIVNPAYSVEIWTPDGRLERIVRRPNGRRAATPVELSEANEALTRYAFGDEAMANRFRDEVEAPDSLPAAYGLTIGSSGDLWILREGSMPSHEHSLYDVFDGRGYYLGEMTFPAGFVIHEVGTDYVLGMRRDENDVPFVELYALERS